MSSNVGLTTPRGSGTSGYVQRNTAFMKPRNAGYGAPYPPVGGAGSEKAFKQRVPDKKILEHDRLRGIEVRVLEERERLEEENERIEEELSKAKKTKSKSKTKTKTEKEEGEEDEDDEGQDEEKVLTEEEIDERCEAFRAKLLKEMEEGESSARGSSGKMGPPNRRNLKSYQVHELAEAKIEESERLRKALGIKENGETGEISSSYERRRRD